MRQILSVLAAGCAVAILVLGASPSGAQTDRAADRRIITEGETAWGAAFVTGDVASVQRLLAGDFLGVTSSGRTYDKSLILKQVAKVMPGGSDQTGPLTIVFHGDTAIMQGHERETDPPPSAKVTRIVFTDTWIRIEGHWRIVAAQDTGAPRLEGGSCGWPVSAVSGEINRRLSCRQMRRAAQVCGEAGAHQVDEVVAIEAVRRRWRGSGEGLAKALQRISSPFHMREV